MLTVEEQLIVEYRDAVAQRARLQERRDQTLVHDRLGAEAASQREAKARAALLGALTVRPSFYETFEQAWARTGYQYGEDALSNVRLGWELACGEEGTPKKRPPEPEHPPCVVCGIYTDVEGTIAAAGGRDENGHSRYWGGYPAIYVTGHEGLHHMRCAFLMGRVSVGGRTGPEFIAKLDQDRAVERAELARVRKVR